MGFRVGCVEPCRETGRERFGEVEFQSGLVVTGCCVDISSVFVQRNDGGISDQDVSKPFETSVEVISTCVEILDSIIENLSKERNEARFELFVERRVRKVVTVSHLDVAFKKRPERSV